MKVFKKEFDLKKGEKVKIKGIEGQVIEAEHYKDSGWFIWFQDEDGGVKSYKQNEDGGRVKKIKSEHKKLEERYIKLKRKYDKTKSQKTKKEIIRLNSILNNFDSVCNNARPSNNF